jgi:hypothetical protein
VEPRALKRLMQLAAEERLDAIAEGLGMLAEQVGTLSDDLSLLTDTQSRRGLTMLSAQADEEAAKALILLDVVRMDNRDQQTVVRQLECFYDHLARCIYVEIAQMNPANFAEVRTLVQTMRPSRYLDGPNDVDWIFRNQLLAQREESLYVDYIHEEGGDRWITPATNDDFMFAAPPAAIRDLVGALDRLGCTSRAGLAIIASSWTQKTIEDETPWLELVAINQSIVEELINKELASADATQEDVDRVIEHWPFPMGSLDLSQLPVSNSELQAERDRWYPDY